MRSTALVVFGSAAIGGLAVRALMAQPYDPRHSQPSASVALPAGVDPGRSDTASHLVEVLPASGRSGPDTAQQNGNLPAGSIAVSRGADSSASAETRQERQAQRQELLRVYNDLFEKQPREQDWARDREPKLRAVLESVSPSESIRDVSCASTMCRVVLAHDEEEARRRADQALATRKDFASEAYFFHDSSGKTSTIYIGRDSHSLARLFPGRSDKAAN